MRRHRPSWDRIEVYRDLHAQFCAACGHPLAGSPDLHWASAGGRFLRARRSAGTSISPESIEALRVRPALRAAAVTTAPITV